jgi:hypothetical protein
MISPCVRDAVEPITAVTYDWLAAEVASSSDPANVNAILNDYSAAIQGLEGGFKHPNNFTWNKHDGHMGRLEQDYDEFIGSSPEKAEFNKLAARIVFYSFMEISGRFRNQCYAEAKDSEDYLKKRRKAVGVSISNMVRNRLTDLIPMGGDFTDARISAEGLKPKVLHVIGRSDDAIERFCGWFAEDKDSRSPDYHPGQEMICEQYRWLNLAIDSLILITKCKDGRLPEVPFMEPRSISEQSGQLWHPFREPIDWAKVMATNPPPFQRKSFA